MKLFTLKCVVCGRKDTRDAEKCHEMQYCDHCMMPMTLEKVVVKPDRKARNA